jgi:uracil-DNA glycosylase family 4
MTLQEVIAQIVTCEKCDLSQKCNGPVPMSTPRQEQDQAHRTTVEGDRSRTSRHVLVPGKVPSESGPKQTVPSTAFIVLGEAPGRLEDQKGEPFVGPAGKLLRKVLGDLGIEHRAIYMNSVSCWPRLEESNKPTPDQKRACRQNLKDQLDVVTTPWVLCCGTIATQAMVRHATAATNGHVIPVHGKIVFPVWHPAFILYKRDQELYMKWKTSIGEFLALMSMGMVTDDHNLTCLYCKNPKYSGMMACYKHRKDWMVDQVWSQKTRRKKGSPIPGQEGMFS